MKKLLIIPTLLIPLSCFNLLEKSLDRMEKKLDKIDYQLLRIIKKRTEIVKKVLYLKLYKNEIIDKI